MKKNNKSRKRGKYGEYWVGSKLKALVPGSSCRRIPVSGTGSFPGDLLWEFPHYKTLVEVKTREKGRGVKSCFNFFRNLLDVLPYQNMRFPVLILFSGISVLYVPPGFRSWKGMITCTVKEKPSFKTLVQKWYSSIETKCKTLKNRHLPVLVLKYLTPEKSKDPDFRGAFICFLPSPVGNFLKRNTACLFRLKRKISVNQEIKGLFKNGVKLKTLKIFATNKNL